jgi:hypothetical protein
LLEFASHVRLHTGVQIFGLSDANEALLRMKLSELSAPAAVLKVG